MREQEGEDRIVAKSKPTTMNLAFIASTSSSTVQNPIASKSLGILKALRRTDWSSTGKLDAIDRNPDAASSSQGWQKRCSSCRDRRRPGTPELSWRFGKYREICRPRISRISKEFQEIQETREPKDMTKIGHTISIFQQTACRTWTRSSRSWDKEMVAVRRIQWKTSMWTQLFGENFCLSLFKLQFILGKISQKICDPPRINPWSLWDSYFMWLRGWSRIRQKLLDWPWLTCSNLCGERRLC